MTGDPRPVELSVWPVYLGYDMGSLPITTQVYWAQVHEQVSTKIGATRCRTYPERPTAGPVQAMGCKANTRKARPNVDTTSGSTGRFPALNIRWVLCHVLAQGTCAIDRDPDGSAKSRATKVKSTSPPEKFETTHPIQVLVTSCLDISAEHYGPHSARLEEGPVANYGGLARGAAST